MQDCCLLVQVNIVKLQISCWCFDPLLLFVMLSVTLFTVGRSPFHTKGREVISNNTTDSVVPVEFD